MGAGQSTSPSLALHVLRVTPSSPASETNIEPFFDFVVGFQGDSLPRNNIDASALEKIVEQHEGRSLNLLVWNSKSKDTRGTRPFKLSFPIILDSHLPVVPITPSRAWSSPKSPIQNNNDDLQPSLLGLSMRMCGPELSGDNVWHVMDVLEGSPAESAGLVPYGDWIIGWSGGVLSAENDFYDLVDAVCYIYLTPLFDFFFPTGVDTEQHIDKPLRLYVYSYDFDTIREAVVVPNHQWGGEGLLGCVFGFVFFTSSIHRITTVGLTTD
jgi:GRASP55/65 PDZ-like domain